MRWPHSRCTSMRQWKMALWGAWRSFAIRIPFLGQLQCGSALRRIGVHSWVSHRACENWLVPILQHQPVRPRSFWTRLQRMLASVCFDTEVPWMVYAAVRGGKAVVIKNEGLEICVGTLVVLSCRHAQGRWKWGIHWRWLLKWNFRMSVVHTF